MKFFLYSRINISDLKRDELIEIRIDPLLAAIGTFFFEKNHNGKSNDQIIYKFVYEIR